MSIRNGISTILYRRHELLSLQNLNSLFFLSYFHPFAGLIVGSVGFEGLELI